MATVGGLNVDLTLETASFQRDMGKAVSALHSNVARMRTSMKTLEGGFASVTRLAGIFGVSLGVGALVSFGKRALDAAGGLGELAEQSGTSIRNLQAYSYGAVQAGLSTEALRSTLARLTRSIGDAANGEKEYLDAFERLGIGVLDGNGKLRSTDDILRDLADRYVNAGDKAKFVADAARLGGRSFQQLLPLIANGGAGLDALAATAERAGAILSDDLVKGADDGSDALARLSFQLGKVGEAGAAATGPWLKQWANGTADWIAELRRGEGLIEKYFDLLTLGQSAAARGIFGSVFGAGAPPPGGLESQVDAGLTMLRAPGGTGATNPSAKGVDDAAAKKIQGIIDKLNAERDAIGQSATEMEVYNNLKAAGVTANSAAGKQIEALTRSVADETLQHKLATQAVDQQSAALISMIDQAASITAATRTPMEQYQKDIERANELIQIGFINQETYNRRIVQVQDALARTDPLLKALEDSSRDFGQSLTSAFEDAIIEGKTLGETLRALGQDLARLAFRAATSSLISTGINALVRGALGGIGGGAIGGQSLIDEAAALGIGALASGGPVAAGQTYLVGEAGPELFRSDSAGNIVSNADLAAPGGGTVNNFQVDMRGASVAAVQRLERFVNSINGSIEKRAVGAVYEEQRRNGRMAVVR